MNKKVFWYTLVHLNLTLVYHKLINEASVCAWFHHMSL